jgi:tetratricopeptide (TPR) repeat protein
MFSPRCGEDEGPAGVRFVNSLFVCPFSGFCGNLFLEGDLMIHFKEEWRVEDKMALEGMERFLRTELSREDNREVVRRMLAGTPRRSSFQNPQDRSRLDAADRYDEAFRKTERVLAAANERIQRERQLALTQWSGLEGHPPARRLVMVRNDTRLHHWGLFDLLAGKSRTAAQTDAVQALEFAELALAVAGRLDPQVYGEERVCDFRTTALVILGDARRLNGDFAGARLAFSQARIHLETGTRDLLEEAGLLDGLVSLLCDLGEYEKAAHSLERASALYRRMGDHHLDGASLAPSKEKETGEAERRQAG